MPISCLSGIFLERAERDCEENRGSSVPLSPGTLLQPSEAGLEIGCAPCAKNEAIPSLPNSIKGMAQWGCRLPKGLSEDRQDFHLLRVKNFCYQTVQTDMRKCEVKAEGPICGEVDCYSLDLWNEITPGKIPWSINTSWISYLAISLIFQKCHFHCCSSGLWSSIGNEACA